MKLTNELSVGTYYFTVVLFQTLSYPFLTMQRRLECRSAHTSQLLPNEIYNRGGFFSCMKTMV